MRIASLKSLALWIIIGVIIIALIASFYPFAARANIYNLYASACLGGWENTHLATGLPQAFKNEKESVLTSDNSARLNAGTLARIYCGGFTGDILVDTIPTRILTRFSWAMEYPGLQIEEVPAPKTEPSINEDLMQEVNALLEEKISEPSISPQPQEYPITQDIYGPIVQDPKQQAESSVAPETLESASVILKPQTETPTPPFNPFEAIPREENQTTEITETQNESLQNEPTPETPTTISTEAPVTIIRTEAPINDIVYGLLEVTYTLDGIEWKRLGFVRANEFHNKYFEIPIEEASDWEDISKIQISVQGVPTLDSLAPTIYLDAIWLEVEYQKPIEDELVKNPFPSPSLLEGDVIVSKTPKEGDVFLVDKNDENNENVWIFNPLSNAYEMVFQTPEPIQPYLNNQEEELQVELIPPTPPLKERRLERMIQIDRNARHSCIVQNFNVNVYGHERITLELGFKGARGDSEHIEIGSLPLGIDITFLNNNDHVYVPARNISSTALQITNQTGSQKGNFNILIIYTIENSTTICQINIINF